MIQLSVVPHALGAYRLAFLSHASRIHTCFAPLTRLQYIAPYNAARRVYFVTFFHRRFPTSHESAAGR